MKNTTIYLLLALFFLVVEESQSAPFKLTFNGTVTSVFTDPSDPFAGTIDVGTHMAGFANYETSTLDDDPSPDVGSYSMFSSPPLGMALFIGGNTFAASDFLNISVANNIGTDVDQLTMLAQEPFRFPEDSQIICPCRFSWKTLQERYLTVMHYPPHNPIWAISRYEFFY